MGYVVTGAETVLGRSLVRLLLARDDGPVHVDVTGAAAAGLERLGGPDADRVVPLRVAGPGPQDGMAPTDHEQLAGTVRAVFHLAPSAALSRPGPEVPAAVVAGTRSALELATAVGAGGFHHLSAAAVGAAPAGPEHAALTALRDSEALVRDAGLPWRIYRPGLVVGRSDTGEADADDPLSRLFVALRTLGEVVPEWVPLPAPRLGTVDIAPADVVAAALDELGHRDGLDGRALAIRGDDVAVLDLLRRVARLAEAPRPTWPTDAVDLALLTQSARLHMLRFWPAPRAIVATLLEGVGFPPVLVEMAASEGPPPGAAADPDPVPVALAQQVPPLRTYERLLWRYWEDHLDPRTHGPSLDEVVGGKVVLVTGASAGIGRSVALQLARAGAHVLLVARTEQALRDLQAEIAAGGGRADVHPTDLSSTAAAADLARAVLAAHGRVDVLVNNAGLSINRPIAASVDRLRDFERTMAVNYFGPVALMLGLLPSMRARGAHVVNVLSGVVQAPAPGFGAYGASKAALDNFSHALRAELSDEGIAVTNIYMGLVHTAMSDPTEAFRTMVGLSAAEAAEIVADAIVRRPEVVSTEPLAALHATLWALWPSGAAALIRAVNRSMARQVPPPLAGGGAAG